MTRALALAARRLADQTSTRLSGIPASPMFFATVTSLSPLRVTWRGGAVPVVAHGRAYTPALGDWVLCSLINSQVVVLDAMTH